MVPTSALAVRWPKTSFTRSSREYWSQALTVTPKQFSSSATCAHTGKITWSESGESSFILQFSQRIENTVVMWIILKWIFCVFCDPIDVERQFRLPVVTEQYCKSIECYSWVQCKYTYKNFKQHLILLCHVLLFIVCSSQMVLPLSAKDLPPAVTRFAFWFPLEHPSGCATFLRYIDYDYILPSTW